MRSSVYRATKLFRYLLWGQACLSLLIPLFLSWYMWVILGIGSPAFWQSPLYTPLQQIQMIGWQPPLVLLALYVGSIINFQYVRYTLEDTCLELSNEGIALHQLGLSQFAYWKDVKALKQFLWTRELILHRTESSGVLSFVQFLVRQKSFLLTPFVSDWYYSDLKKDLEHYAPQLFDSR